LFFFCLFSKKWNENKFRVDTNENEWHSFLKLIIETKSYLILRICNLNLLINFISSSNLNEIEQEIEQEHENLVVKIEKIDLKPTTAPTTLSNTADINLENLLDCINKVKSYNQNDQQNQNQNQKIMNACCYYLNDHQKDNDDDLNNITSSCLSPNTEVLAFTSEMSSIYLYNLNSNHQNQNQNQKIYKELLGGHTGCVFQSKFTHDSKYLLSCGEDSQTYLWNLQQQQQQQQQQNQSHTIYPTCAYSSGHLYPVWCVDAYSRLNLFCTGAKDSTARLWSFDRLYPLRTYCGHQSDINCIQFHPNASYMASGSSDKTIRLWSVQSGEFVRLFSSHRSRVYCLAFSPDGNYLASGGEDKRIKLWDLRMSSLLNEFKSHTDCVYALEFDLTSKLLLSGGLDQTVKVWDLNNGGLKQQQQQQQQSSSSLIQSINVNFNVYSMSKDQQNTFYFTGAQKKSSNSATTAQNQNTNKKVNTKNEHSTKINNDLLKNINNNSKTTNLSISNNLINANHTGANGNDAGMSTRRRIRRSRRRTAAANETSTAATRSVITHDINLPPNSTNYLLDNHDLYEV
jgi:WD40 repeat protein